MTIGDILKLGICLCSNIHTSLNDIFQSQTITLVLQNHGVFPWHLSWRKAEGFSKRSCNRQANMSSVMGPFLGAPSRWGWAFMGFHGSQGGNNSNGSMDFLMICDEFLMISDMFSLESGWIIVIDEAENSSTLPPSGDVFLNPKHQSSDKQRREVKFCINPINPILSPEGISTCMKSSLDPQWDWQDWKQLPDLVHPGAQNPTAGSNSDANLWISMFNGDNLQFTTGWYH